MNLHTLRKRVQAIAERLAPTPTMVADPRHPEFEFPTDSDEFAAQRDLLFAFAEVLRNAAKRARIGTPHLWPPEEVLEVLTKAECAQLRRLIRAYDKHSGATWGAFLERVKEHRKGPHGIDVKAELLAAASRPEQRREIAA